MSQTETPASGLYAELRRRHVLRTLALYILGAWGLMQVADVVLPGLGLPEESIRYLLLATIAGFPVALVFAWFFDISDGGIRRTPALADGEATDPEPLRAVDYGLLAALALVLGLVIYGVTGGVVDIPLSERGESSATRAAKDEGPPMVGVLPFAQMGSTDDGAFFADGVHDDLLTRLAKMQSLRVISRTSVLQYADTTRAIPEIGRELGADAILEGAVRVAGNQIRINAQLIDARTDEHLWAETYDRELTTANIFAIQSEIARAIADALTATLSPEDYRELEVIPTKSMAAYRAFHEAIRWRGVTHLTQQNIPRYIASLENVLELDPRFTRPMMELVHTLSLTYYGNQDASLLPRIESLIERIGEIAPDSAEHLAAKSLYVYYVVRDFDAAEALIQQAQQKAPSDTHLIDMQSWIQRRNGDYAGYLESSRRMYELEPTNPQTVGMFANRLMLMHRFDEAREIAESIEEKPFWTRGLLALLDFMEHKDFARVESDLDALRPIAEGVRRDQLLEYIWEVQVAQRHYDAAASTIESMSPLEGSAEPLNTLPRRLEVTLFTQLLTGDRDGAAKSAQQAKALLGMDGMQPEQYPGRITDTSLALVMIAAGEEEAAYARINPVWQDPDWDRSAWAMERVYYCELLALMGHAEDAVLCLRSALRPPGPGLPFLEPLMPFFDPIRNHPDFAVLMAELVEDGWITAQQLEEVRRAIQ